MAASLRNSLTTVEPWKLFLLLLASAELIAVPTSAVLEILMRGHVDPSFLLSGAVTVFVLSLAATVAIRLVLAAAKTTTPPSPEPTSTRLMALINTIPDMVIFKDTAGRHVLVNKAVEQVTGHGAADIIGKTIEDMLPPEPAAACRKSDEDAMGRTVPTHAEELIPRPDGTVLCFDMLKAPVTDEQGCIVGLLAIGRDVTASRKMERALSEHEEQYRALADASAQIVWTTNARGEISDYSPSWRAYTGQDLSQRDGYAYVECFHPDDRDAVMERWRAGLQQGVSVDAEVRLRHHSGRWRWNHVRAVPIRDKAGNLVSWIGTYTDIHERKEAEEKLRASEARYRMIVEHINDAFFIHDLNGRITDLNEQACRLTGYTRSELLAGGIGLFQSADGAEKMQERMTHLIETGTVEFDGMGRRKDGSSVAVAASARLVSREGSGIVQSFVRDITERKQMEQSLRESEEKFRNLFEYAADAIFILSPDGWILDVNRTACEQRGYTKEEMLALHVSDVNAPEYNAVLPERLARLKSAGHAVFESGHRRKDGSLMVVEVNGRVIEFGGKQVILSMVRDITQRKQIEERVRQNEEFIRNILDTVDEGFIVVDREYRILTANRAYCEQAGSSCVDILGRSCYAVSHRSTRPCCEQGEQCVVRDVFATGRQHAALHIHRDRAGNDLYVETKGFPIRDASGTVVSVIETISDITEKRLLEEERLKTQKLEAVGTLAGGIAHDFNNLLQGIFGNISLAKLKKDDRGKSTAALEEAEKALHMAVKLTNQLLTFSKGGKPVKKILDALPLIENAAKFALSGSRSNLRVTAEADLWKIDADDGQISQVIQNIVLNADQAMPDAGSIEIAARNVNAPAPDIAQDLSPGRYVEIAVTDTGIGIPEKYLHRIFDPYFTTKEKGSGLGLATSYSIIRNHNGSISVTSEIGKQTTFRIYLPAAAGSMPKTQPMQAQPAAGRRGRILVMDDEEIVLNVAGELLRALGHDVDFARNGAEALDKYRTAREAGKPFDVAILDLTIRGGMGGAETIARLLAFDPSARAIVSSGYSDDSAIALYEKQGFKAVLRKPYDIDELRKTLNSVLGS